MKKTAAILIVSAVLPLRSAAPTFTRVDIKNAYLCGMQEAFIVSAKLDGHKAQANAMQADADREGCQKFRDLFLDQLPAGGVQDNEPNEPMPGVKK